MEILFVANLYNMNLSAFSTILSLLGDPTAPETGTPVPLEDCTVESVQRILDKDNIDGEVLSVSPEGEKCTIELYTAPESTPLPGSTEELKLRGNGQDQGEGIM